MNSMNWRFAAVAVVLFIASCNSLPVPEEASPASTVSDESKVSPVYDDYADEAESKIKDVRSIDSGESKSPRQDPSVMITKALEDVSNTLGTGIKNLGNSAIQILEGTGVAAEQALGSGARIITGVAETAAEATETGAKSIIRIAHGVANSLTQGTKSLVETKTNLLKGLTGANPSSSLQADASSNNEAVQRNERAGPTGYGGYNTSPSYGPNTVAETPNNFVNVFSQAAANTVNFGTQLLNSLVGVAANLLQVIKGTVSTLLSLLNAKGQVVGAVVQSAPPVLASVTRTAGDVLAAKARIFGAVTQGFRKLILETLSNIANTGALVVTQAADTGGRLLRAGGKALRISVGATTRGVQSVSEAAQSFGRQLATVFGDSFSGLFQRMNDASGTESTSSGTSGGFSASSAFRNVLTALTRLGGGAGSRESDGSSSGSGSGSGSGASLGGFGQFAQTLINAKLNLLNGFLSPFTGGRPLLSFGRGGGSSSSLSTSSNNNDYASVGSEPNFRISIAATSPSSSTNGGTGSSSTSDSQSSNGPRAPRFYANPDLQAAPKLDAQLTPANLVSTFNSGVIKGIVDQFNIDLKKRFDAYSATSTPRPSLKYTGFGSSAYAQSNLRTASSDTNAVISSEEQKNPFSRVLPLAFSKNSAEKKQE